MKNKDCPMILATVNCSIGDKNKHFSIDDLLALFKTKKYYFTPDEKYMISAIQEEADEFEINSFQKKYNISQEIIDHILSVKPCDIPPELPDPRDFPGSFKSSLSPEEDELLMKRSKIYAELLEKYPDDPDLCRMSFDKLKSDFLFKKYGIVL